MTREQRRWRERAAHYAEVMHAQWGQYQVSRAYLWLPFKTRRGWSSVPHPYWTKQRYTETPFFLGARGD